MDISKQHPKIRRLVPALLRWFSGAARDLPWRRTSDPYAIWVSEIMLQQTQVKTVIPFWERWMEALPTIEALAQASSGRVHKLWEGLGYYTRVRNLQRAAQLIGDQHGGAFPERFEDVLDLPGVGRYTAGAVCSIAFNQPRPVLDGNVTRVLARLFGIRRNVREKATVAQLWQLAEELVLAAARPKNRNSGRHRAGSCSRLNQSLMELGALVCTPKAPNCPYCPVRTLCVARRRGEMDQLPNLGAPIAIARRRFAAFVAEHKGRLLVRQRPNGVVNAHLWEFPNVELSGETRLGTSAAHQALGFTPRTLNPLLTIHHSITRYRIELNVFRVESATEERPQTGSGEWLTAGQLQPLAFSSAHRKILKHLGGSPNSEHRSPKEIRERTSQHSSTITCRCGNGIHLGFEQV
jgi:A/G-specific adenine glycosylase